MGGFFRLLIEENDEGASQIPGKDLTGFRSQGD